MNALVTGAQGFVGRHMVAALVERGYTVRCVEITDPYRFDALALFRSSESMVYDLVVHAAAQGAHRAAIDGQPATTIYNRLLDAAMFEWAVRTGQRRVLYLSSSAVYPASMQRGGAEAHQLAETEDPLFTTQLDREDCSPFDAYGWTKLAGEQMAAAASAAGVPVHIVRPFSGYGADQALAFPFAAFVARARAREDPFRIWGDGQQVRDWIHIDDVVVGALAVVDADERRPVNLCTGIGTRMIDLAQMVCAAAGYEPEFDFDLRAPAGVSYRVGDPTRMREIYTPRVTLAEGVAQAMERVGS